MGYFKMINEQFICDYCLKKVKKHPNGSARNHCTYCLYSKHLDKDFPGDRKSNCHGLMRPIGIDYKKNKGYMIKHRCLKCNKEILNKIAIDDNFLEFSSKINKTIKIK